MFHSLVRPDNTASFRGRSMYHHRTKAGNFLSGNTAEEVAGEWWNVFTFTTMVDNSGQCYFHLLLFLCAPCRASKVKWRCTFLFKSQSEHLYNTVHTLYNKWCTAKIKKCFHHCLVHQTTTEATSQPQEGFSTHKLPICSFLSLYQGNWESRWVLADE